MSTFYFSNVKTHSRGATWADGSTRTCTRCQADPDVFRAKQATVTAVLKRKSTRFKVPVGYCDGHIPEQMREKVPA